MGMIYKAFDDEALCESLMIAQTLAAMLWGFDLLHAFNHKN